MFTVEEKTTLVGITDLRTKAKKMIEALKDSRVVLTERSRPCAVVLDYKEFKRMQDLIELAEEGIDAIEIKKRRKKSPRFLTHDQVLKELSLS